MIPAPVPSNDRERLEALHRYRILDSESDTAFDGVVELAAKLLSMPIALISLVDKDRQWFKASYGLSEKELPRSLSFCGHAICEEGVFEIQDATQDPRFHDNPMVIGEASIRYYAAADLVSEEGLNLGTLCVMDQTARRLTDEQLQILTMLSRQVCSLMELNLARAELTASRDSERHAATAFIESILDNIREGIVACDSQGRLTLFNRATREFHGIDMENLPPESWAEKYDLYEEDGKTLMEKRRIPLFRALNGEEVRNQKMVIAPKNGKKRTLSANGRLMFDQDGKTIGAVVSMYDLTEQRQVEAQFQQAQKLESIGRLTGGMAHDLNNLLGVIIGNLDLLLEDPGDDRSNAIAVNAALEAALKGADLNRRLLAFARRQPLQPERIDIQETLRGMAPLIERALGEQIVLKPSSGKDVWPVMVDPAQLESAILNLCVNARDAMPEGGALILEAGNTKIDESYVSTHPDASAGDHVAIAVTDSGCGIPPEILSKVFEPFFSTKAVHKGSGLGLSMVHGFLKQSGGFATIHSRSGVGTTVKLFLPRDHGKAGPPRRKSRFAAAPAGRGQRILVVEDNKSLREIAARLMEEMGYKTLQAENAALALQLVEEGAAIDLVFTDQILSDGMTGTDLAKTLRKRFPELPVIITSGYTESALDTESFKFLVKPYRRADLGRALSQSLPAEIISDGS